MDVSRFDGRGMFNIGPAVPRVAYVGCHKARNFERMNIGRDGRRNGRQDKPHEHGPDIIDRLRESQLSGAHGLNTLRHPGLDPGSMISSSLWTPDQVRGDEGVGSRG